MIKIRKKIQRTNKRNKTGRIVKILSSNLRHWNLWNTGDVAASYLQNEQSSLNRREIKFTPRRLRRYSFKNGGTSLCCPAGTPWWSLHKEIDGARAASHMYLFLTYSLYMSMSSLHSALTWPRPVITWLSNTILLSLSTFGGETL